MTAPRSQRASRLRICGGAGAAGHAPPAGNSGCQVGVPVDVELDGLDVRSDADGLEVQAVDASVAILVGDPVGTIVTGTSGLAAATGAHFLAVAAVGFYIGLLVSWGTVAIRTGHGVFHGHLLRIPA